MTATWRPIWPTGVGAEFAGRISGVQRFGLFIRLDETGADGLIPIRSLGASSFTMTRAARR